MQSLPRYRKHSNLMCFPLNTAEKTQKRSTYTFLSFCLQESENLVTSIAQAWAIMMQGLVHSRTAEVVMSPVREYRAISLRPFVP